jgi:methylated-DNA-[protein]-cysteine S-methyltransferase
MRFRSFPSRLGEVLIAAENEKLRWLCLTLGRGAQIPDPDWVEDERDPLLGDTKRQITSYFAGRRERFELPLAPQGTPFQKRVWKKLLTIPYGMTWAYSELACRLSKPSAFQAVGAANGQNPISVIIPCHRLVGKNGNLTDYGGGLDRKRKLLELEGAISE